jgi:DNA repair protein RecN (Recombination protein N)
VFDEVDTGIGGEVADRVGLLLQGLSSRFQVICVTHLPQIAAHAKSHFHVSKLVLEGRTVTQVKLLGEKERVFELARLMTGGVSPQALASARELLEIKQTPKGESERAKAKG